MDKNTAVKLPDLRAAFKRASVAHIGIDMQRVYCEDESLGTADDVILAEDIEATVGRVIDFAEATRGRLQHVWVNHTNFVTIGDRPGGSNPLKVMAAMGRNIWHRMTTPLDTLAREEMYKVQAAPGDMVIGKKEYDGFYKTALDRELRARGIDTLLLSGLFMNVCVWETARSAKALGYDVYMVEDLTQANLDGPSMPKMQMRQKNIHIVSAMDVLAVAR